MQVEKKHKTEKSRMLIYVGMVGVSILLLSCGQSEKADPSIEPAEPIVEEEITQTAEDASEETVSSDPIADGDHDETDEQYVEEDTFFYCNSYPGTDYWPSGSNVSEIKELSGGWWSKETIEGHPVDYVEFKDDYVYTSRINEDDPSQRISYGKNKIYQINKFPWGYRIYVEGNGMTGDGWVYETKKGNSDRLYFYGAWDQDFVGADLFVDEDAFWKNQSEGHCLLRSSERNDLHYDRKGLIETEYTTFENDDFADSGVIEEEELYSHLLYQYKTCLDQDWNIYKAEYLGLSCDATAEEIKDFDYALYDINMDGTKELIIFQSKDGERADYYERNFIIGLYTIVNGKVKTLITGNSYGARDDGYYLLADGKIMYKAGGTGYIGRMYYELDPMGNLDLAFETEEDHDDPDLPDGKYLLFDGKYKKEISREKYEKIIKDNPGHSLSGMTTESVVGYENINAGKAANIVESVKTICGSKDAWYYGIDDRGNVMIKTGEVMEGILSSKNSYAEIDNCYIINIDSYEGNDWYGHKVELDKGQPAVIGEVPIDDPEINKKLEGYWYSFSTTVVFDGEDENGEPIEWGRPEKCVEFKDGKVYEYCHPTKDRYIADEAYIYDIHSIELMDNGGFRVKYEKGDDGCIYSWRETEERIVLDYFWTWDEDRIYECYSGGSSLWRAGEDEIKPE